MSDFFNYVAADDALAVCNVTGIPGTGTGLKLIVSNLRCTDVCSSVRLRLGTDGTIDEDAHYETVMEVTMENLSGGRPSGVVWRGHHAVIARLPASDQTSTSGTTGLIIVEITDYSNEMGPKILFGRHTSPGKPGWGGAHPRLESFAAYWHQSGAITNLQVNLHGSHFCEGTRFRVRVE